jgi:mono/diheme cytochrome c family protein
MSILHPSPLTALAAILIASPMTCLEGGETDDPVEAEARKIWTRECGSCHGMAGDGAGLRSAELDPPAPDFSDPCRHLSPEWIERVILSGGASYRGSAAMRPYHELTHRPEVLQKLVTHVHSLRREGACPEGPPAPPIDLDDI